MTDYLSGKAYREALRSRPRQTSTPAAREGQGPYAHLGHLAPITRHSTPPMPHKETVGWMGGQYHERTTPNADARTGTDRLKNTAQKQELGSLNKVRMKPKS